MPPPAGTVSFSLIERAEARPEMLERAERYGWPTTLDAPLFIAVGPDGPHEIDRDLAMMLAVALASAIEHDRQGAGFGMGVSGQMVLADGRRVRWRATLKTNVPLEVPPGLRLFSGEVRHDLIPEGTVVGLGGLPWQELEAARRHAQLHQPPHPERPTAGDALPVLILGMERAAGEHVARELDAASPEGIALIDVGGRVLVVIVTDSGMHGVAQLPAYTRSMAQFRLRLTATGRGTRSSCPRRPASVEIPFMACSSAFSPGPLVSAPDRCHHASALGDPVGAGRAAAAEPVQLHRSVNSSSSQMASPPLRLMGRLAAVGRCAMMPRPCSSPSSTPSYTSCWRS